ncbi:PREDICTED: uncharacterized protein LOC104803749 [Tarenaya hassleriana]|uniref:uncharacterized protein LOC104803749 n=1 Tax=Tarenaya hassleriana TaxID=28532 RepID=UPI00053C9030|nr:PREDICTED: uncharacterized protein LOC104803749 [Tarenaya hassleriana]
MEVPNYEETLQSLNSCLSQIKWRFKSTSKRRLEIDVLALCTGMRPVVMIDYGGKMPELQDRLLALLGLMHKESPMFKELRVMVIEDMIYLINVRSFSEYITSSFSLDAKLFFVDLEHDPPKMIEQSKESKLGMQLISIQKLFSSAFPLEGGNSNTLACESTNHMAILDSSTSEASSSQSSLFHDLSRCLQDTQITIPTLNGWLLGYPVVYLFGKDHIEDAIYNLSTKSLRIFRILVSRNMDSHFEELTSFSVPYDLSMGGRDEPWAEAFLGRMRLKWEECKHVWTSLELEVSECYPQAIVL